MIRKSGAGAQLAEQDLKRISAADRTLPIEHDSTLDSFRSHLHPGTVT